MMCSPTLVGHVHFQGQDDVSADLDASDNGIPFGSTWRAPLPYPEIA